MGHQLLSEVSRQQQNFSTMKTLIVLSALVAVALAQFSCDNCDGAGNRQARTGCRFFCYFDFSGSGVVTREDMKNRFNADKDTDAGMTRGRFVEQMKSIVELGGGSADLLTEQDIDTLADLFELVSGTSTIT